MTDPKNILIIRTDRIGDVVLTLPLASIIKKHLPDSKITFLVNDYTKALAENAYGVDNVLTLQFKNKRISLFKNLSPIKNKFDVCIVAYPTFKISLILFLSKIRTRIGTGYRWYSFFFNNRIYDHRKYGEHHELEFNVRLLKPLGIDEQLNEENVSFNLQVDVKSRQKIENLFNSSGISENEKIVIVHPGSGGSAVDLPFYKLKILVTRMAQELDCIILITGSKNEKELCGSLVVNNKTINMAGNFDLYELTALIDKSLLLIANSTGPIHIAAALGKYVIGFYPKIASCAPKRWGPYTVKKKIFSPEIECDNCSRNQCERLNCMDTINIDNVFISVRNFLIDYKPGIENENQQ